MGTNDAQAAFVDRLGRHRGILVEVAAAYCRDPAGREDLIADGRTTLARLPPLRRAYRLLDLDVPDRGQCRYLVSS
jgi:hypothetical protein